MPSLRELMTLDPETVEPDRPALAALDLMIDRGVRHLPVLDRRGRLRGVVSIDDLRAAFPFAVSLVRPPSVAERQGGLDLAVGEVMTHGAITARPEMQVAEAASMLVRFRIGCLPVVDDSGKLVGIFSESDALKALISAPAPAPRSGRMLDLELLVASLRAERVHIAKQVAALQDTERALSADRHDVPTDSEEQARLLTEIGVEEPLASLAARRLAAIDHALDRAARGRLGSCEACKQEIPIARLRAVPGTSLCRQCAARQLGG
ncbi:MAG TPA: CBS domain-containing protein [Myxococcota bacterium]|nr:CBS domain-containing protein [Myxococcota bacterium]